MLTAESHSERNFFATHGRIAIRRLSRLCQQLFRAESSRAALFLILLLNVDFFPCIWGDRSLLQSAQYIASILPSGASIFNCPIFSDTSRNPSSCMRCFISDQ